MSNYVCYTQWNRLWVEAARFEAADNAAAYVRLREVLPIEHCGRPIALEILRGPAVPSVQVPAALPPHASDFSTCTRR